jgi:hypothetical protein
LLYEPQQQLVDYNSEKNEAHRISATLRAREAIDVIAQNLGKAR